MTGLADSNPSSRHMACCEYCGRTGRFYRDTPKGYLARADWAAEMIRTHYQERCPGCDRYTIWKRNKK
jgi:hypothetical protein